MALDEYRKKRRFSQTPEPDGSYIDPAKSDADITIASLHNTTKARKSSLPKQIKPALPSACRNAPQGNEWLHEIKFDGYRMLCRVEKGQVQFFSRNGKDWTSKLKRLASAAEKLNIRNGILDGEVVMMADDGTTSFQSLQNRIGAGYDHQLRFYVFDLLYLNGYDLRALSLVDRKILLQELLARLPEKTQIYFSDHISGDGPTVFQQACHLGAEGIVSKRKDAAYVPGRITSWLKTKCLQSREFIVGGFSDPASSRVGFGALLIGFYNDEGELCYAGRVGTGFTDQTLTTLKNQLDKIAIDQNPFDRNAEREKRGVHWVDPTLVVEVEFAAWTKEGVIRFPSYRGLRDDLSADELDPVTSFDAEEKKSKQPTHEQTTKVLDTPGLEKLKLTNADRIVYPEAGVSKLGVATYYAQAAEWMLPHIVGRPLSLLRCPQGCHEKCFFQKHAPRGLSDSVERIDVPSSEGSKINLVIHDVVGLLALVQFGVLEFHVWGARSDDPLKPDRMVFDLDPDPSVPWKQTIEATREVRERLADVGLVSFVKTTGGKGLHVVIPLRRRVTWNSMKSFSELLANRMVVDSPGRYTNRSSKQSRSGKIYIDYMRNVRGATSVAAYSTRARESASISLPIHWSELESLPTPNYYTLKNVNRRFQNLDADPWEEIHEVSQSLTKPMTRKLRSQ